MGEDENKEQKLTDEEVWLRAYIAAISLNHITADVCQDIANDTLRRFKNTFRNNND